VKEVSLEALKAVCKTGGSVADSICSITQNISEHLSAIRCCRLQEKGEGIVNPKL
jgi:hypothetical protein